MVDQVRPQMSFRWVSPPPPPPGWPAGVPQPPEPSPIPATLLPWPVQSSIACALAVHVFVRQRTGRPAPRFGSASVPALPSLNVRPFAQDTLDGLREEAACHLMAIEFERMIRTLEAPLSKREIIEGDRQRLLTASAYRVGQLFQMLRRRCGLERAQKLVGRELSRAGA